MEMRMRQQTHHWGTDYIPERHMECPVLPPASRPAGWKKSRPRRGRHNLIQGFEMNNPNESNRLENYQKSWLTKLPWSYADAVKKPNNKQLNQPVTKDEDVVEGSSESSDQEIITRDVAEINYDDKTNEEGSDGDSPLNPDASEFVPGATSSEKDEMTTSVTISTTDDDNNEDINERTEDCSPETVIALDENITEQHKNKAEESKENNYEVLDESNTNEESNIDEVSNEINVKSHSSDDQDIANENKENNPFSIDSTVKANTSENLVYFEQDNFDKQPNNCDYVETFSTDNKQDDFDSVDQSKCVDHKSEFEVFDHFTNSSTFREFKDNSEEVNCENISDKIIYFENELNFEELVKNKENYSQAVIGNENSDFNKINPNTNDDQKDYVEECNEDNTSKQNIEEQEQSDKCVSSEIYFNSDELNDTIESLDVKENEIDENIEQYKIEMEISEEMSEKLRPEEMVDSSLMVDKTCNNEDEVNSSMEQDLGKEEQLGAENTLDLSQNSTDSLILPNVPEINENEEDFVQTTTENEYENEKTNENTDKININENFFSEESRDEDSDNVTEISNQFARENPSNEIEKDENNSSETDLENNQEVFDEFNSIDRSSTLIYKEKENTNTEEEHKENIDNEGFSSIPQLQDNFSLSEFTNVQQSQLDSSFEQEIKHIPQDIMTTSMYESQDNDSSFEIINECCETNDNDQKENIPVEDCVLEKTPEVNETLNNNDTLQNDQHKMPDTQFESAHELCENKYNEEDDPQQLEEISMDFMTSENQKTDNVISGNKQEVEQKMHSEETPHEPEITKDELHLMENISCISLESKDPQIIEEMGFVNKMFSVQETINMVTQDCENKEENNASYTVKHVTTEVISDIEETQSREDELSKELNGNDIAQHHQEEEESSVKTFETYITLEREDSHTNELFITEDSVENKETQLIKNVSFEVLAEPELQADKSVNEIHMTEICEAQEIEEEAQFNEEVSQENSSEAKETQINHNEILEKSPKTNDCHSQEIKEETQFDKEISQEISLEANQSLISQDEILEKFPETNETNLKEEEPLENRNEVCELQIIKEDISENDLIPDESVVKEVISEEKSNDDNANHITEMSSVNEERETELNNEINLKLIPELNSSHNKEDSILGGDTENMNNERKCYENTMTNEFTHKDEYTSEAKELMTEESFVNTDNNLNIKVAATAISVAALTTAAVGAALAAETVILKKADSPEICEKESDAVSPLNVIESKELLNETVKSSVTSIAGVNQEVKSSPVKLKTPLSKSSASKPNAATNKSASTATKSPATVKSAPLTKATTGTAKTAPPKATTATKPSGAPTKTVGAAAKPGVAATAKPIAASTAKASAAVTKSATSALTKPAVGKPTPATSVKSTTSTTKPTGTASAKPNAATNSTAPAKSATKATTLTKPSTANATKVTASTPTKAAPSKAGTSTTKPGTPIAKPGTPIAKPGTPIAKPGTPTTKSPTVTAKPTPPKSTLTATKPATSISKTQTALKSAPLTKPGTPPAKATSASEKLASTKATTNAAKTVSLKASTAKPTSTTTKVSQPAKKPVTPTKQSNISSTGSRPSSAISEKSVGKTVNGTAGKPSATKVTANKTSTPGKTPITKQGTDSPSDKSKTVINKTPTSSAKKSLTPAKKPSVTTDKNAKNAAKSLTKEKPVKNGLENGNKEEEEPVTSTTGDIPIENSTLIEELPPQIIV